MSANRQNLLLRLDMMQGLLSEWRQMLNDLPANDADNEGDSPELLTLLNGLAHARDDWEAQAELKRWDDPAQLKPVTKESQGLLRQMFFGGLMGNRQRNLSPDPNEAPGSKS